MAAGRKTLKRMIAVLLCLLMLVVPVVLQLYVVNHAQHHCTQADECPICLEMHAAASCLWNIRNTASKEPFSMALIIILCVMAIGTESICTTNHTLISLKVELLN